MFGKIRKYGVVEDYKPPYLKPVIFSQGEVVSVGKEFTEDPEWQKWVWCEGDHAKAWIPKQFLEINRESGVLSRAYDAREINAAVGEELQVSEIFNGFGIAEKVDGSRGWMPMKNLEAVEE